jgi:hypothetical protein
MEDHCYGPSPPRKRRRIDDERFGRIAVQPSRVASTDARGAIEPPRPSRQTGELPSREALDGQYSLFRQRFGPDLLKHHDGESLLSLLHETKRDSLVYWLEFKDDAEFPAHFGSIAGGSALKYGLYKRNETGAWMTGAPTAQRELSTTEAIALARRNRDQLIAASELLSEFHWVDQTPITRGCRKTSAKSHLMSKIPRGATNTCRFCFHRSSMTFMHRTSNGST